jgi:hypothetical protein
MRSTSQASFVARLARAEQLYQFLISFPEYQPNDEKLTAAALSDLIEQLHTSQTQHTTTQHYYLLAAFERRKIFLKEPNSIGKLLSPITSYVRAKLNNTSQQYHDVNSLVKKIRGKVIANTKNPTEVSISNSERSYGSQLQNFNDIITLLQSFGDTYQPTNGSIRIAQLQATYQEAVLKTNLVTQRIAEFKPKITQRHNDFTTLAEKANNIKEMVKSQYGISSTEYSLIRNLNFSI